MYIAVGSGLAEVTTLDCSIVVMLSGH